MARPILLLCSLLVCTVARAQVTSAPTTPESGPARELTARAAVAEVRGSLARIEQLVNKARDDRNPNTLNCVFPIELRTDALLADSSDRLDRVRGGQGSDTDVEQILEAAKHAREMDGQAFACVSVADQADGPAPCTHADGPQLQASHDPVTSLLNLSVPWVPWIAVPLAGPPTSMFLALTR